MPGQRLMNIHDAVRNGDTLELESMVKRGASINEVDSKNKFTALHWACHCGALECLHWLLWHGADLNVKTPQGWTPIHIAAIRGQDQCIQALGTSGASMNCRDQRGNTPAHLAAAHGNSYTLSSILRAGTDIEAKNMTGWTPVHVASYHGRLGCLQLLVKWGARTDDTDSTGNIPAHLAACEGHLPCLKFLVSHGASMSETLGARNDNGETPKTLASQFYKQNCVDYINAVEWERDHPEDEENLAFPAHIAAYTGDLSHLKMLIEQGVVNINERDEKGSTPAHKAAGNGHLECLQWLVEMGANIHIQNSAGETPLEVATRFAQLACVKLLKGDESDSDEGPADYAVTDEDNEDKIARLSADHGTGEGESIPLTGKQKEEARGRALKRVEELERLLGISKQNYHQLGGRLDEDRERRQRDRESDRVIGELESQLEYERLRREKLESQLDQCRSEIQHLNAQLERASTVGVSEEESKPKKKIKKKTRQSDGGVFVKRTVSKPAANKTTDFF
ncbi:ankyrin repeat domain-containing protein 42-like [Patiria miniata]|uniref:Ankyrin repeat domain-containing protein 42 n=1 Tax=Patiria miniata TaxID=46514 RepID=A0A914B0M5_PATMI|nr:ankyrin repeat domain-containing protein 42-like [Patiria miniata]